MDTKTVKAELVKGLEDAITDEASANAMYWRLRDLFDDWYLSYPEGLEPVSLADKIYMKNQVGRIAEAESAHKDILTALRDRIKALPDG